MTERKRVLLLRPDKAGDAVKTLPALRALKQARPELELHVLASQHNVSLFENESDLTVHALPTDWQKWKPHLLRTELFTQGLPTTFSVAVNLLCDTFDEALQLLASMPSPKKFAVVRQDANYSHASIENLSVPFKSPAKRDESQNIADILSTALECNLTPAWTSAKRAPTLCDADRAFAEKTLPDTDQKRLAVCPFAGTEQRSHRLRSWRKLLARVSELVGDAEWVIFCPAHLEAEALEMVSRVRGGNIRVVHPPHFRALGACLERVDAVLAVDSGPLHLAQAMEIPSLGFLSGGDKERWFARLNPRDKVLRRGILGRFPSSLEMWWAFKRWFAPFANA